MSRPAANETESGARPPAGGVPSQGQTLKPEPCASVRPSGP